MKKGTTRGRSRIALALAAVVAVGFSTLATTPAFAQEGAVTDAVFSWGINNESNAAAYFGGCNYLTAGAAGNAGSSRIWTEADGFFKPTAGNVSIVKPTADGGVGSPTWANKCQTPTGTTVTTGAGNNTGSKVQISNGTGTVDPATGAATINWTGDFTVVYYGGMTYWTASNPVLTVDADGHGTVTATGSGYAASMENPDVWAKLEPQQITLANLSNVNVTATGFTATPDYVGVVASGEGIDQTEKNSGNEAYWGAFPADFLNFQVKTGQNSYWYSSGGAADLKKPALPLSVSFTAPDYTPVITTQPVASTVALGSNASFTVAASGGAAALTYKWQSSTDGTAWADVSGATAATLSVAANGANEKLYRAIVTDGTTSVTSNSARLTVSVPTPTVTVSKSTGLNANGETITVSGTGFFPNPNATTGTRPPLAGKFSGAYVAFGKFADVWKPSENAASTARTALGSATKWGVSAADVATIDPGAEGTGIVINADGTFTTELTVMPNFSGAPATGNYGIYTYGGGGAKYAPFETYTPIVFTINAPDAPAAPTLTADGTSATATWTAPTVNGGSAVTGYTVTLTPGTGTAVSKAVAADVTTATFPNLVRGESYVATVVATNAVGTSAASAGSAAVQIAAVAPSTPAAPTATAASQSSINVGWVAPVNGGSAITGYTVSVSQGGSVVTTQDFGATATSGTISGLSTATAYSVSVSATNAVGTSELSSATSVTTLASAPDAVAKPTVSAASGSAINVAWVAPADGGSAITGYTVSVQQGGTEVATASVGASTTTTTVSGLTAGTSYTATVTAINAAGTGATSPVSDAVQTYSAPAAPAAPTATLDGTAGVAVVWTAPSTDGGSAVTGYTVSLSTAAGIVSTQTVASDVLTAAFAGLTPGTSYTASVVATNAVGSSSASAASNSVQIAAVAPVAPAAPVATASGQSVAVNWTAPSFDGGSAITGYTVELRSAGSVVDTTTVAGDVTTVTFSGLGYSTAYTATVVATNAVGSSAASAASEQATTAGPTAPPANNITSDDLNADNANGLEVTPAKVTTGATVSATGLNPSEWYFVSVFSTKVELGWFQADASGTIRVALTGVPAGEHRLAIQDLDGNIVGWQAITVAAAPVDGGTTPGTTTPGAAVPAGTATGTTLPNTGLEVGGWIAAATLLLLAGAAVVILRSRRVGESK